MIFRRHLPENSFVPDPMGEGIVNAVNTVVADFSLSEEMENQRRANHENGCGCRLCFTQYEDALDRRDWTLEIGKWLRVRKQNTTDYAKMIREADKTKRNRRGRQTGWTDDGWEEYQPS